MRSMGLHLRFLIFLFPLILSSHGASVKKEFSLNPPYIPDGLQHWDLVGSARAGPQVIRLTEELPRQKGVIWNKNRVLSNSWEVQMNFRIAGKKSSGEGLALWYVRDPAEIGPVFGSRDYFSGLGIFIDTVSDQDHHEVQEAYVSAIVNNGSLRFLDSRLIGECQTVGRNLNHPSKIAVSYSRAGTLSVFVDTEGSNKWKLCFTSLGVHLPTAYRFGLSASTDFADTHEILSLQMLDLDPADKVWEDRNDIIPFAENVLPPTQHTEEDEEEEEALTEEEERAIEELMKKEKERLQELVRKEAEKRNDEEEIKMREEKEKQARVISENREKEEKRKEREEKQRKEREEKQRTEREEKERKEREEQQRKDRENEEKLAREKREVKEEMPTQEEKAEEVKEDVASPPVSFTRKAIYVLGTAVIFLIAVKLFRKYNAQRRERLHKRLY